VPRKPPLTPTPRKPPPAAEAWVAGAPGRPPPGLPASPAPRSGRKRVQRADGRELVRLLVYLPPDLAKALDVYAAVHTREKSAIVTDLLRELLKTPERQRSG